MNINESIIIAKELGKASYLSNKSSAPCTDSDLMKLISMVSNHKEVKKLLNAWNDGFYGEVFKV